MHHRTRRVFPEEFFSLTLWTGRARSALRRVLKRLTTAIANLLNMSKNETPVLDYESLLSLSNASRVDAIRAIDRLSHRLGSTPSRSSVASSSSSSSKHKRHHSSSSSASASSTRTASRDKSRPKGSPREQKSSGGLDKKAGPKPRVAKEKSPAPPTPAGSRSGNHSRGGSGSSKTAVANRISLVSISTDSTRLGEIPERKWRRRYDYDTSSEDYNVSPVYPLKPYRPPEVKGRRFWRLLRRQS